MLGKFINFPNIFLYIQYFCRQKTKDFIMEIFIIMILSGGFALAVAGIVAQRIFCRKIIREKDRCIVRHLQEQQRLAKELEHVRIEMEVMEKMLSAKFDGVVINRKETEQ